MTPGRTKWQCLACGKSWTSINIPSLHQICQCGNKRIKAVVAAPSVVSPRLTLNRSLNWGMELLREAQE